MTDLASPLPDVRSGTPSLLPVKLALALGIAALADWLFWNQRIGLSMALFAVALLAGSYLANFRSLNRRRSIMAAAVLLIALVPAVEELNGLSSMFVVAGVIVSAALLTNPDFSRLSDGARACRDLFLIGPFRLIGDVARTTDIRAISTGLTLWFVPLIFGGIFLFLFASRWLVRMNLISLTATLYVCALINFSAIIADYNVSHSKEATGRGVNLDDYYLASLGPQALPALDRARLLPMVHVGACGRSRLLSIQAADMASWRAWGFRSWRLQRYLDAHQDQPPSAS